MGKAIWFRAEKELKIILLAGTGAFLFGMLICFLVVRAFPDEGDVTSALIATFLALLAVGAVIVVAGGIGMQGDFYMAVSMSHTRRSFLVEEGAVSALLTLIGLLLGYVLYRLDLMLLHICYSDVPIDKELDMRPVFGFLLKNPINLLCVLMAFIALRLLIGALYLRFGQWAFWGIWLATMTLAMGVSKMGHLQHTNDTVLQVMNTIPELAAQLGGMFFQMCGIVLSLVAIVIAAVLLRKQEVKGC